MADISSVQICLVYCSLTADDVFRLCKAPDELYLMEDMAVVVAMATWLAIM